MRNEIYKNATVGKSGYINNPGSVLKLHLIFEFQNREWVANTFYQPTFLV